ncbi:hypothetical protein [Streptomyces sp. NPDC056921]|uniref:hypothetical protein n=1 Tax=Streptomyces sp. NPDC056921 TaxID=3345966 RepID=UPI00362842A9
MQQVRRFLYRSGGVRLTPRKRSERHLSGSERETKGSKGGRRPAVTAAKTDNVRTA